MKRSVSLVVLVVAGLLFHGVPATVLALQYQDTARRVPTSRSGDVLQRTVTLELDSVTLDDALQAIAKRAEIRLIYNEGVVPLARRVSLHARRMSVGDALASVLNGVGVEPRVASSGEVALVRTGESRRPARAAGTITGRVTDAKSGEGLVGAEVMLEGTRWRASSGEDGRYRLSSVEAGSYTLVVRRVGYAKQTRAVVVSADEELAVDVGLQPLPTQLDEVVTTVTGEQRLRELGHVVGRINADSLVKEAPVSNLSELLNGRVPGLQVFQAQGTVGGEVHLQVRGPNSVALSTEPIVIVDGVRYTTGLVDRPFQQGPANVERTSPLNDINPNDIESIEVVKGPSAATLYGTDAANGVIVVTTKRGRPGPARWNAYAKGTLTSIPEVRNTDAYWGWPGAFGGRASCSLQFVVQGVCTQDSVTALPSPLADPELTVFGTQPRWEYGGNVAGGREDLRYYFSGDFEDATGPIQMPRAVVEQLEQQRGVAELPDEQLRPNAFTKANLRANVTAMLGREAEFRVNAGYIHSATRTVGIDRDPYRTGMLRPVPGYPYGQGRLGRDPAEMFAQTSTERTDRFVGTANGQWRPTSWLVTKAIVGLDLTGRNRASLVRRGDALNFFPSGAVGDDRVRQLATTAEVGATATAHRGRLSSRTSVGVQYVRNLSDGLSSFGLDLPPGGTSVGEAANVRSQQIYHETVTLGSYLEQTVGLNERLFLTGALRVDGASAFGQDYDAVVYPKASVSWLVSEEPFVPRVAGLDELRLRYAYGASGQQPRPEWARPSYDNVPTLQNGTGTTTIDLVALGNPDLRPERVREHEIGLDAAALGHRVQLGLTWYQRRTVDQIVQVALPQGLGSIYTNLGVTKQHGFEAELTARLLDTRFVSWDVVVQHSLHRTRLADLGAAVPRYHFYGGWVEGYPLGARFMPPLLGYDDANGDGILAPGEVELGDTPVYAGESMPPESQTLSMAVGLADRRLRVSALLERRAGFTQVDDLTARRCAAGSCRASVDPTTPLSEQAEAAAMRANVFYTLVEPGDFTRLREVAVAFDLPAGVARALRVRSATLSVAGRNLALWTDFGGPDPESASVQGAAGFGASGIPQGRSWTMRLDLGF